MPITLAQQQFLPMHWFRPILIPQRLGPPHPSIRLPPAGDRWPMPPSQGFCLSVPVLQEARHQSARLTSIAHAEAVNLVRSGSTFRVKEAAARWACTALLTLPRIRSRLSDALVTSRVYVPLFFLRILSLPVLFPCRHSRLCLQLAKLDE